MLRAVVLRSVTQALTYSFSFILSRRGCADVPWLIVPDPARADMVSDAGADSEFGAKPHCAKRAQHKHHSLLAWSPSQPMPSITEAALASNTDLSSELANHETMMSDMAAQTTEGLKSRTPLESTLEDLMLIRTMH